MGMKLFDDARDDDVDEISNIEINKEFAKRYEHNKKREDLQKLDEMKKKGLINDSVSNSESDSESEFDEDDDDDDDDDNPKAIKKDLDFFDALLKVRKQDPILKDESAKLFESSSDEEEEEEDDERESGQGRKREKEKPKYLKDVIAEHLIEDGPEFDEDGPEIDEDEDEKKIKTYVDEQEDLKKEVLDGMAEAERENDGEGGDLLKLKEREEEDDGVAEDNGEFDKKLDEYFGEDEKLDENNKFLKDFFKNKLWIDKDKGKKAIEDDLEEISDDEDLEKQEEYERDFNFRFEENASDRIMGHSRVVEGSVRKETNARKQQRERKKERLAQAEAERREEVKRLKNLKKKEIQEKLNKIREIGGITGDSMPLTEDDLEEEFDPDEYDKKMKAAFGDNYYEAEDADPGFVIDGDEDESDLEKPDFDKEDELLGLPKDWDVIKSNEGFLAEREKMLKSKAADEGGSDDNDDGDGDDDNGGQMQPREGKRKRKQKLSLKEKVALDKELEEMHKLDYEGSIGDLKTRFKYREVAPRKYGLTGAHILMIDDKELNQYVPLKKIAPYREKEWAPHRMQRMNIRLKGSLFEAAINGNMGRNKKRKTELGETSDRKGSGFQEDEKVRGEQPSNDESNLSRAARRRRNQKEKKLPLPRLIAYGKIPSSSKSKSKS